MARLAMFAPRCGAERFNGIESMRNDVKIGLVLSLVVVVVAGWYFVGRGRKDKPVPIDNDVPKTKKLTDASRPAETPGQAKVHKPAARPSARDSHRKPPARTSRRPVASDKSAAGIEAAVAPPRRPTPSGVKRPAKRQTPAEPRPLSDILIFDRSVDDERQASGISDASAADSIGAQKPRADRTASMTPSLSSAKPTPETSKPVVEAPRKSVSGLLTSRTPKPAPKSLANVRTHVVGPGDTIAILAEIYYGSQACTDYLLKVNPDVDPRRLAIGTKLLIPAKPGDMSVLAAIDKQKKTEKTETKSPATVKLASRRTYTVKPGDSFYKIAREVLGDESRWREVFELNKDLVGGVPERLQIGQIIKLPQEQKR